MKIKNVKEFFIKRGIVGAAGGIWAMLPDIDYFLEKPIFHHNVPYDIFFFHGTFDTVIPETDLFFAAEMLLLFAMVNLFAMAVSVESFKRLNEAIFGKKEEEEEAEAELDEAEGGEEIEEEEEAEVESGEAEGEEEIPH